LTLRSTGNTRSVWDMKLAACFVFCFFINSVDEAVSEERCQFRTQRCAHRTSGVLRRLESRHLGLRDEALCSKAHLLGGDCCVLRLPDSILRWCLQEHQPCVTSCRLPLSWRLDRLTQVCLLHNEPLCGRSDPAATSLLRTAGTRRFAVYQLSCCDSSSTLPAAGLESVDQGGGRGGQLWWHCHAWEVRCWWVFHETGAAQACEVAGRACAAELERLDWQERAVWERKRNPAS
jgi:hypothetical protein